jgi:hypothetical protein
MLTHEAKLRFNHPVVLVAHLSHRLTAPILAASVTVERDTRAPAPVVLVQQAVPSVAQWATVLAFQLASSSVPAYPITLRAGVWVIRSHLVVESVRPIGLGGEPLIEPAQSHDVTTSPALRALVAHVLPMG